MLGRPFSAFCYGAPSRGVASHALLRHNNAAGKSHIQYDPPLSRLPAKQRSNATLFAGLNHVNENAIGAGSVVGLASWLARKEKTLLDIGARLCFVADLLSRNLASSTPRPTESALLPGKAPFCSSTARNARRLVGLAFGLPPSGNCGHTPSNRIRLSQRDVATAWQKHLFVAPLRGRLAHAGGFSPDDFQRTCPSKAQSLKPEGSVCAVE